MYYFGRRWAGPLAHCFLDPSPVASSGWINSGPRPDKDAHSSPGKQQAFHLDRSSSWTCHTFTVKHGLQLNSRLVKRNAPTAIIKMLQHVFLKRGVHCSQGTGEVSAASGAPAPAGFHSQDVHAQKTTCTYYPPISRLFTSLLQPTFLIWKNKILAMCFSFFIPFLTGSCHSQALMEVRLWT